MQSLKLLQPVTVGNNVLKNRMAMAPMTRCRAINNLANDLIKQYYTQRASAGLIITEGVSPSPNGLGYIRIPGIFNKQQVESWKPVTKAIHEKKGVAFMQLMHTGRIGHHSNLPDSYDLVAPSPIAAAGKIHTEAHGFADHSQPREMTRVDIAHVIDEYVTAAKNAIAAGFDGVEIHAASGYLPNQFLASNANQRTDEYGGHYKNRARFVIELIDAVTAAIGSDKVGIKFSPGMAFNDIHIADSKDIYSHLALVLNNHQLAYVHVMRYDEHALHESGFDIVETFRDLYKGTLLVGGGLNCQTGEALLQKGLADMIVYGNLFISNPDLPKRFELNAPLQAADKRTFYTPDAIGFTDYPALTL